MTRKTRLHNSTILIFLVMSLLTEVGHAKAAPRFPSFHIAPSASITVPHPLPAVTIAVRSSASIAVPATPPAVSNAIRSFGSIAFPATPPAVSNAFSASPSNTFQPSNTLEARIYDAFITGEMDDWVHTMDEMERRWELTRDMKHLYALVEAQYGYIAYLIAEKEKKTARKLVKVAEDHLEGMIEYDPGWARARAMLGAVYGFKVGLDPYKAVVFGMRSFEENNLALELAPDDPQVWMEKANIELYKPSIFGDNSEEAMKMYQKSIRLYEEDPDQLKDNWLYLNAIIGLASAAVEAGEYATANDAYQKILRLEPEFKWIRDEVYPEFRAKHRF